MRGGSSAALLLLLFLACCSSFQERVPKTTLQDFQTKCHEETVAALQISEELKTRVKLLEEQVALLESELKGCESNGGGASLVTAADEGHKTVMSELHSHTFDVNKGKPLPFIGDHYPMDFNEEHMHVEVVGTSEKIAQVILALSFVFVLVCLLPACSLHRATTQSATSLISSSVPSPTMTWERIAVRCSRKLASGQTRAS
jgi:hypothetical protein